MNYIDENLTRQCQVVAYAAIIFQFLSMSKCLVKMFCGSGKSRLITATIIGQKKKISVVVVPSLALIQQFYDDYLSPTTIPKELSKHKLLNVSSKSQKDLLGTDILTLEDIHIECTTDPVEIKQFLNSNPKLKKIICVTYQSLDVLLANLDGHIIGLTLFDEAHRTASHKYKELIYGSANIGKYEKQVFLTATPINKNGITMYDRENNDMGIYGDCGPLHPDCHYTYLNGLRDDVLSLFNIRIDMFTGASETRKVSLYECIARSILATGNSRVLTFHKDVAMDSSSDTSVLRFIQNGQTEFKFAFDRICANEFPEKTGLYNKITLVGLTAGTKNKKDILTEFGKCDDNEIFIVASCGTIGEGVDTKNANMTVFVDPKTSVKDIIQNIGRVCRKIPGTNRPAATVLIPVWVDMQKYRDCGDDVEKRDEVLREQLNLGEKGDYNAVLNVCAALQQEDQELYDLCLRYPSNFTEAEREHTLTKQGCRVDYDAEPLDECDIEERIESGQRVEIHTNNPDEPVIIYNEDGDDEDAVCLYMCEDDDDTEGAFGAKTYYPIVPVEEKEKEKRPRNLDCPTKTNRPRIDYHTNDEMRILWKVADDTDFSNRINSAVIECKVERLDNDEIWKNKRGHLCEFMDTNKRTPLQTAEDNSEKKLGMWISTQKKNYNAEGASSSKERMKNPEIWQIWTDTLADPRYNEFLKRQKAEDPDEDWKNKQKKTCEFIDTNKKAPLRKSKDPTEKTLVNWIDRQKGNYNPKGASSSKYIMKTNPEIWQIWTNTLADPRYKEFLKRQKAEDPDEDWKNKQKKTCEFIDTNKKAPLRKSKDPTEKILGTWIGNQKTNYNAEGASSSKCIMKTNLEIWQIWTNTLADPRYKEFLKRQKAEDPVEDWKNKQKKTCEFMDTNKKAPSGSAKDPTEKTLASWISTQKGNYNLEGASSSNKIMKNDEIWQIWKDTLIDPRYKEFLVLDPDEDWKNKRGHLCEFMDTNKKAPSQSAKDPTEKKLASWISNQKTNYNAEGASSSKYIMKTNPEIWQIWTNTLADPRYKEFLKRQVAEKTAEDPAEDWKNKREKMCEFMDTNKKAPSQTAKDPTEKKLGAWINTQKWNYNAEGACFSKYIMKNPDIWQIWTDTLADPMYKELLKKGGTRGKTTHSSTTSSQVSSRSSSPVPTEPTVPSPKPARKSHILPIPNESKITQVNSLENVIDCGCELYDCLDCCDNLEKQCEAPHCKNREKSEYQKIGTSWAIQKSTTTHDYLSKHPEQWKAYHDARDFSFKGYIDQSQIPRNRIITHLEKKAKHKLRILDLGCGRNYIAQHFREHAKMKVIGYDHVVEKGSGARVGNILDLCDDEEDENTDICVYSQSLMGTDKMEYLREGYRMLRYNGEMIICDSVSILDDVQDKLQEIGMKVEELEHNDSRWFLLCARKY
jgi:superfamily II DNA or RNA helicase